jgi:hypothetical protein
MISSMSFLKDPENAESSMIDRIVSENKKTEKEKEEKAEQSRERVCYGNYTFNGVCIRIYMFNLTWAPIFRLLFVMGILVVMDGRSRL